MRNIKAVLLTPATLFFFSSAFAQPVSIGVKGGVSMTEPQNSFHDESRRYLVGPSIELHLPFHFAVEADALYSRVGSSFVYNTTELTGGTTLVRSRERGNSWQFPLLGKYYFGKSEGAIQPFLGTGFAFRTISYHTDTQYSPSSSAPSSVKSDFRSPLDVGAVFAGGLRVKTGRLAVLPEFRYVRWGNAQTTQRKNEATFLLGVSF